jgi:hypothetical protein
MPVKTACLALYEALQESPNLEDVHDIAVAVGNFAEPKHRIMPRREELAG